ncbi:10-formyltetrahydrofolate:L-methionyl-tRNA(fMet) N-formyltransferase [Rubrivivax sp. A210]|uniref:methionyl-tRNA formyltransferase n=1 Tax=Rubrivivax sp. A210 TaxID=2772301 RepID=UPI00191B709A|nr:methionyl-tRNA formyltransferase [Rubrivivax sp. A210]CAD5375245.1 10-formyltetrahydrofolate:L-methionyl-tRNA(fMet) N-formyltransferase [Rubrivivax sp. A210]
MRIAYAGTPEFARLALQALIEAGHEIALVLTQPDRPAGRGLKLQPSAVKQCALAHGLALAQPRGLRLDGRWADDAAAAQVALQQAAPELMVVAAYGLILPPWVLALPPRGCLNIHGSLLPRWRGAAPIQRAIEAGDLETGITLMQMDAGLDTGDMLLVEATPIADDDDASTLHDRLAAIGARLVVDGVARLQAGTLDATPQPAEGVTYARKIEKSEAAIDWRQGAAEIERRLRAFDPFPGATAELAGQPVKLWRGRAVHGQGEPGRMLAAADGRLVVACCEGALEVLQLQLAGGRRITARDFLQRHPLALG